MIKADFDVDVNEGRVAAILQGIAEDTMGGWLRLPENYDKEEYQRIKLAAKEIQESSEFLVCIGIGGSYLGHRAIIEALRPRSGVKIIYAGNSLSRRELDFALEQVGDHDFAINVISKSGTTLEPAIAFEAFKAKLIEKYGEAEARKRIYATTDKETGTLHDEAVKNGYLRFVVPDNIGGRYSVLTAVGLLPMAAAGIDIDRLLDGARDASVNAVNEAAKYASMRYVLGSRGYNTEVFASFEPSTMYFNEWLKQLFGESEGKNQQGILPCSVIYSTDLHSLGQFMQDGRRDLFETIIDFPTDDINEKVVKAVKVAHAAGGIPVLDISINEFSEKGFGELIYFFELACAISAKLFGVNPFDQPGVEAYKAELKKLLD